MTASSAGPNAGSGIAERLMHWNLRPVFAWAGIEIIEALDGRSKLRPQIADHHRGGGGTDAINGAIIAYMFDCALGTAVASQWPDGVGGQVTATLSIQYLKPITATDCVFARATVVRANKTLVFAEGTVADGAEETCATATAVYRMFWIANAPPRCGPRESRTRTGSEVPRSSFMNGSAACRPPYAA